METLISIFFVVLAVLFTVAMLCMYLVKDYRNGIKYSGFVGWIQNKIKH
jgi:hypothetical protein